MERLVIFGSSWSQGEWKQSEGKIEIGHSGMTEYLSDRFQVSNFSRASSSIWSILNSLHQYFTRCEIVDGQKIIVFQNDPFFSHLAEKYDVSYSKLYQDSTDIRQFYESILEIFYIKLNNLAAQFNTKIYLCGTMSALHTEALKNFSNLINLCTCWITLLDDSYTPDILPVLLSKDFLLTCRQKGRMDFCEQIMDHTDQNFVYFTKLTENQYIDNPNAIGDFHPNRQGHLRMSNHIKSFFERE